MLFKMSLTRDAWTREAQEASKLVEDIESRVKNKELLADDHGQRVREDAKTRLLDAGARLDRLESLLLSSPSEPSLTDEVLLFRWQMLSDFRVRTAELAHILYTSTSVMRQGGSLDADVKEANRTADSCKQDQTRPLFSRDGTGFVKPLLITLTGSEDSSSSLRRMCQASSWILAAAPILCILFILLSIIQST